MKVRNNLKTIMELSYLAANLTCSKAPICIINQMDFMANQRMALPLRSPARRAKLPVEATMVVNKGLVPNRPIISNLKRPMNAFMVG